MKKTIKISGMACMHCVNSVKEALSQDGITDVEVNLEDGLATVTTDKSDELLSNIITDIGFDVEYIK